MPEVIVVPAQFIAGMAVHLMCVLLQMALRMDLLGA